MPDSHNAALPGWVKALLAILVVAVLVQGWFLYRLDAAHRTTGSPAAMPSIAAAPPPASRPNVASPGPTPSPTRPFDPGTWDPYKEMQRMQAQMDQMFGQAFGRFQRSPDFKRLFGPGSDLSPRVNINETPAAYDITVDLPGVNDSRTSVNLDGQTLHITAESTASEEQQGNNGKMLRSERQVGRFDRTITLEEPVDGSKMTEETKNGVLHIHIPKLT